MENTPNICLLHWNESEAQERLTWLAEAGFSAYHLKEAGPQMLKQLREQSPAAFVIDLTGVRSLPRCDRAKPPAISRLSSPVGSPTKLSVSALSCLTPSTQLGKPSVSPCT